MPAARNSFGNLVERTSRLFGLLTMVAALVLSLTPAIHAADTSYKSVLVIPTNNVILVRLPLTDVTGKVRVKEKTADGFGMAVAPSKTALGRKHYLEWQIG